MGRSLPRAVGAGRRRCNIMSIYLIGVAIWSFNRLGSSNRFGLWMFELSSVISILGPSATNRLALVTLQTDIRLIDLAQAFSFGVWETSATGYFDRLLTTSFFTFMRHRYSFHSKYNLLQFVLKASRSDRDEFGNRFKEKITSKFCIGTPA